VIGAKVVLGQVLDEKPVEIVLHDLKAVLLGLVNPRVVLEPIDL